MACDPNTLVAEAVEAGFCCVTDNPAEMVELYQIRQAAGLSAQTPQQLVTAAKCNICSMGTMFAGVKQYMLCVLAGG